MLSVVLKSPMTMARWDAGDGCPGQVFTHSGDPGGWQQIVFSKFDFASASKEANGKGRSGKGDLNKLLQKAVRARGCCAAYPTDKSNWRRRIARRSLPS
jgi:hypothetical protein